MYSQHSWTAQDCYTLHVLHFDMGGLGLKYGCVCLCQQTQSSDYIELHISLQQLNELSTYISINVYLCTLLVDTEQGIISQPKVPVLVQ